MSRAARKWTTEAAESCTTDVMSDGSKSVRRERSIAPVISLRCINTIQRNANSLTGNDHTISFGTWNLRIYKAQFLRFCLSLGVPQPFDTGPRVPELNPVLSRRPGTFQSYSPFDKGSQPSEETNADAPRALPQVLLFSNLWPRSVQTGNGNVSV